MPDPNGRKYDMVRRELAEGGEATAYELGVALGWVDAHGDRKGMRLASAWCANLLHRGEVQHVAQVERDGRKSWLYGLTAKGRAKLAQP